MSLKEVFILLENLGFVNVVIPFVIIFIVLYSVLNKVKIFKDNKVNSVIACLISFIAIAAADIVKSVNLFSYYIVMALFSAVVIFMFIALAGGKINLKSDKYKKYVSFVVAFLLCLVVFYAVYMVIGPKIDIGPLSFFMFSRFVPILVAVAVFVLIIWYVQSGSSDDSKDYEQSPVSRDDSRRSKKSPVSSDDSRATSQEDTSSEQKVPRWVFEKKIKDFPEKGKIKT